MLMPCCCSIAIRVAGTFMLFCCCCVIKLVRVAAIDVGSLMSIEEASELSPVAFNSLANVVGSMAAAAAAAAAVSVDDDDED